MEIATLVRVLDDPHAAEGHLLQWKLRDVARGRQILVDLAETGLTLDLLTGICRQLGQLLPSLPDPDAVLDAFCRYLFAVRGPLGLGALFERDPAALEMLVRALALGSRWAELLIRDPEAFDLLRQAADQPMDREALSGEVLTESLTFQDDRSIAAALARQRQRHLLRIAYGELVLGYELPVVQAQLTDLVEALIGTALQAALRKSSNGTAANDERLGKPDCAIVALGPVGAREVAYDLSLDLLLIYSSGLTDPAGLPALREQFERVAKQVLAVLTKSFEHEPNAFVRLVALPDSQTPALAHAAEDVVVGFDSFGRTWHRQQMLKARCVAGDAALGDAVLERLTPWLFRRYLSRADETGIKALKRRILLRATLHQDDWRDVRVARGGLVDIESTVEFLQLLTGGDQPAARERSTMAAIQGLVVAGAVTPKEKAELEEHYTYLRQVQHRVQISISPGASELPRDLKLFVPAGEEADLKHRLARSWQTLERLLTSAFPEEGPTAREVELLLDPCPPSEEIRAALSPFGFHNCEQALATLNDLAAEQVPFLSTRRCRHLLAKILPQLLCAVAATPNPDRTLDNLARISNSLGGKGVLWELFRFNPPSLGLYVRLCAASPYLSDILTTNPGMIDELVDSLQLDKLPTPAALAATLAEMCRGAADTMQGLHDFKNAEHLRIGVRDILGKEDIDRTHAALADVAETCLAQVAELEFARLVEKYGVPTIGLGPSENEPSRLVIVGLGKLGGREPNYHSHLDVLFLYEAEGTTRPTARYSRQKSTANNHFFTQLAQAVVKQLGQHTPKGRLYTVDMLLRPMGIGGALALSFADLQRHFESGAAPLWQWQVLCQARPVFGESDATQQVAELIKRLLVSRTWPDDDVEEFRRSRLQLERGAAAQNLKRGPGGTQDIEFIVEMMQLRHAANHSEVLVTNTQAAIAALGLAGALDSATVERLGDSYRFLRRVESGLRLMDTSARHDLPGDSGALHQLALLLGHSNPQRLAEQCRQYMAENRAAFDRLTLSRSP